MGDKIPLMNTEQTERLFYKERKGQSAIEYLMTYGWMLLVVAIVGGAIFATVQGQCTQSSSGFTGQDVQVAQFGVSGDNTLQVELQNTGADSLVIQNVSLTDQDDGTTAAAVYNASEGSPNRVDLTQSGNSLDIGVGTSESVFIEGVSNADGCNTFNLDITYDMGNLQDQFVSGTLTDSMEL